MHICLDFIGVWACFLLAYFVRVGWIFSTDFPFDLFFWLSGAATLVWIVFLLFTRFYKIIPDAGKTKKILQLGSIFGGGLLAVGFLIASYFFPRHILFSRLIGLYIVLFSGIFLFVSTQVFEWMLRRDKRRGKSAVYRTILVGANRVSEKFIQALERDPYAPYEVIGVIDPYGLAPKNFSGKILGKLNKLEDICETENITCIIQYDAFEHTVNLISLSQEKNIKFLFDPALRGIYEDNLRIRKNAGKSMIQFVDREFEGKKKFLYRMIDWVLYHVFDTD